ncbi:MAG: hypothetical protein K2W92_02725 [Alphaproteobacteria bacterium]|nr:hypothetical protein [Alphaproteobacteria bacterium]
MRTAFTQPQQKSSSFTSIVEVKEEIQYEEPIQCEEFDFTRKEVKKSTGISKQEAYNNPFENFCIKEDKGNGIFGKIIASIILLFYCFYGLPIALKVASGNYPEYQIREDMTQIENMIFHPLDSVANGFTSLNSSLINIKKELEPIKIKVGICDVTILNTSKETIQKAMEEGVKHGCIVPAHEGDKTK